jgi:hypothetical protein
MTPFQKRGEDARAAAIHEHALHKVKGAVFVLFIEAEACPYGISISVGAEGAVTPAVLSAKLHEIARLVEQGMDLSPAVVKLS